MAEKLGEAVLELRTNDAGFNRGIDSAKQKTDQLGGSFIKTKSFAADFGASISSAIAPVALATAGIAILKKELELVSAAIRTVIEASDEEAKVLRQVVAGIKSTSGAAGKSVEDLQAFATSLQLASTFNDTSILKAQSVLLTFTKITGQEFDRATQAVADMSTRLGTDLTASALQVGKALNDPILGATMLSRAGVQFSEAQRQVIRDLVESGHLLEAQQLILKELETEFGGSAAAARDTFGGALKSIENAITDLEQELGDGLTPALKQFADVLAETLQDPAVIAGFKGLADGFAATLKIVEILATAIHNTGRALKAIFEASDDFLLGRAALTELFGASRADKGVGAGARTKASILAGRAAQEKAKQEADELKFQKALDEALKQEIKRLDEVDKANEKAARAVERHTREVESLVDRYDNHGAQINRLLRDERGLRDAFAAGEVSAERFAVAIGNLNRQLQELADPKDIAPKLVDPIPIEQANVQLKDLSKQLDDVVVKVSGRTVSSSVVEGLYEWADAIYAAGNALGAFDDGLGEIVQGVAGLVQTVAQLADQWDEMSKSQQALAGASVGGQISGLAIQGGIYKGSKTRGKFGGKGEGDFADVGGEIGGAIGGLFGPQWAVVGGLIGTVIGGAIKRGAQEGLGRLEVVAGEVATYISKSEGGLGDIVGQVGTGIAEAVETIVTQLGGQLDSIPTVGIKVRGDQIIAAVGGLRLVFDDIGEAIEGISLAILDQAEISGNIDEALRQVLTSGQAGSIEELAGFIDAVGAAVTAEKKFIDGMSDIEIALESLPDKITSLTAQFERMGLSASQVSRLVGASVVQFFAETKSAITGQGLSVEEQKKIQRAQAELFNAQLELEISRLEAEKQALLARGQLALGEVNTLGNVIDARHRFVQAEGDLFKGELNLMSGFVESAGGILRGGVQVLEGFVGGISPELAKQVAAIQKVIDALKAIGTINLDTLRLPGAGGGGRSGGRGGRKDALQSAIERLIDAILQDISSQEDLIRELSTALDDLASFLGDLRLTGPTPLTAGQQILALQQQLEEAAKAAKGGDPAAIRQFQEIANRLKQLGATAFGTSTAGFEALLRTIEELGQGVLDEGNVLLEDELDHLAEMRETLADILEENKRFLDLTQEEIDAIREGDEGALTEARNLRREFDDLKVQAHRDQVALQDALRRLARILGDAA